MIRPTLRGILMSVALAALVISVNEANAGWRHNRGCGPRGCGTGLLGHHRGGCGIGRGCGVLRHHGGCGLGRGCGHRLGHGLFRHGACCAPAVTCCAPVVQSCCNTCCPVQTCATGCGPVGAPIHGGVVPHGGIAPAPVYGGVVPHGGIAPAPVHGGVVAPHGGVVAPAPTHGAIVNPGHGGAIVPPGGGTYVDPGVGVPGGPVVPPPGETIPEPKGADASRAKAIINVTVPADAKITVNGYQTTIQGEMRRFTADELELGQAYDPETIRKRT